MKKRLFGSSRGQYFRDPERRSSTKNRSQKVRFRRRYATSVLKDTSLLVGKTAAMLGVMGAVAFGGTQAWRFWQTSQFLRVGGIEFSGDIPPQLAKTFPVKAGHHLLQLEPGLLEKKLAVKYPELEYLTITRRLDRSVNVSGHYRTPVAIFRNEGRFQGLDRFGVVFPMEDHNPAGEKLPLIKGTLSAAGRTDVIWALDEWKENAPEFYSLVKSLETDNIRLVRVVLDGDVVVHWGELTKDELLVHTKNIQALLDRFSPSATPANLRIVSTDRIVMDQNWIEKK